VSPDAVVADGISRPRQLLEKDTGDASQEVEVADAQRGPVGSVKLSRSKTMEVDPLVSDAQKGPVGSVKLSRSKTMEVDPLVSDAQKGPVGSVKLSRSKTMEVDPLAT
jgi:hypothetical protein